MDDCRGHGSTQEKVEALQSINTKLRFFLPNYTHPLQPADSLVIRKIKAACILLWEEQKMQLLLEVVSSETNSGRLPPGKRFFMKLAADEVWDVIRQRDETGMTYARKEMMCCGLSNSVNGLWGKHQLFLHL